MKNRVCSLLIVHVCFFACTKSTFAATPSIQPLWEQVSTIKCILSSYNGLLSNSEVSSTVINKRQGYNISLTVSIQKYYNGDYIDTGTSWTTSGKDAVSINKTFYLSTGVYIAHAVAVITDSSGQYIETVTWDSSEYYAT